MIQFMWSFNDGYWRTHKAVCDVIFFARIMYATGFI